MRVWAIACGLMIGCCYLLHASCTVALLFGLDHVQGFPGAACDQHPRPCAPPAAAAITPGRLKDRRTSQVGVARSQLLTGVCRGSAGTAALRPPCLPLSAAIHCKRCLAVTGTAVSLCAPQLPALVCLLF